VLRSRLSSALCAGAIGVTVLVGPVGAQAPDPGALSEVPLPNGLRAALAAIDDRVAADRSQFLLEFIRRTYQGPDDAGGREHGGPLRALLAHLAQPATHAPDTLPLPLTPAIWIDAVFDGGVTEDHLAGAILRSRQASLLYYGLLSLDEGTRAWLATQPGLVAELARRHAAGLVVAGPALRVADGRVRAPGGEQGEAIWQALVGRSVREPAGFVRALLRHHDGRLAYFFAAMAQLSPAQRAMALDLASVDERRRVASGRRVYAIFERVASTWRVDDRPFWRPVADPALLLAELRVDSTGTPILPGTRRFWEAVWGRGRSAAEARTLADGQPVDVPWLLEQVFNAKPEERRRRQRVVLFASRTLTAITRDNAGDAVEALRGAGTYPALVAVLERSGVTDVRVVAQAARRATELSAVRDQNRALPAVAQFQGALALTTRAASRSSASPEVAARTVSSLLAVNLSSQGEYEGGLVRWFDTHLRESSAGAPHAGAGAASCGLLYAAAPGSMDCDLVQAIAGRAPAQPRLVDWEGTRYGVDFPGAELARLARLLGEDARPYLSSARTLLDTTEALLSSRLDGDGLREHAESLALVLNAVEPGVGGGAPDGLFQARHQTVLAKLHRLAREGDVQGATQLAAQVRSIADGLFARGLLELVYAAALGHPDRIPVPAGETARRHNFGFGSSGALGDRPWHLPTLGGDPASGWRVSGSLLGLDVRLAQFSLLRVSSRRVPRKPTLHGEDRRLLVEAVTLVEPGSLTEPDREVIVTALRKGRARLAATRSSTAAAAIAEEIRLTPARRALLSWVITHDPDRLDAFLSPGELFWLGLEGQPVEARLHAWGAPGEPRLGCLCLRLLDRRPWEALAGRWPSGLLASGFPDLNLRLAELLAELGMPASMLGPVLASATLDLVDSAQRRDPDDRRGLVEFVQALSIDQVEQYLSLLTSDGPLVPLGRASEATTHNSGTEEPR
jgi:hypothetical protein